MLSTIRVQSLSVVHEMRWAVDSMSSSVSVDHKRVTEEHSYLIKLEMCEDRFPINARMIDYKIERTKIRED